MSDRKEIVKALDELWQGFADTLRLRHEYDPNDDAVMVVIHERDIELLRNVSILLEEQEEKRAKAYEALTDLSHKTIDIDDIVLTAMDCLMPDEESR